MQITEVLVTAFHGEQVVIAANLSPDAVQIVTATTTPDGDAVVDTTDERASHAFTDIATILQRLAHTTPRQRDQDAP